MSREEAKQILADKPIGSYLIFEIIVIDENRGIQNFEMIEKCKYPRQSALVMGSKLRNEVLRLSVQVRTCQ